METMCSGGICPLSQISWMWYAMSVVVAFVVGAFWYSVLFGRKWAEAIRYECACGADLAKGQECTCKRGASVYMTFLLQFASTALIGLMYFVLTGVSVALSALVVVAVSAWMKATLKFEIPDFKRWITLCAINVGYFFVASLIFILFSLL